MSLLILASVLSLSATHPASTPHPELSLHDGPGLTGTVITQDTGLPVPGAIIQVEGSSLRTRSNSQGAFSFAALPDDMEVVVLHFTRLGFEPESRSVPVEAGTTARIEVRLQPRPVELPPLSILLERTRMVGDPLDALGAPGSAFHLSRNDLRGQSLPFGNVHDMLRLIPGVNVQDEEGYGSRPHIGMRGAGAERSANITLMEDGVLIAPAPYSAPAAYYFPTAGRMEGIEVRKGASQVRYGPRTVGGAVNLLSSSIPDRRSWHADVAGGGDATFKAHLRVGDRTAHVGWMIEGYQLRTDGYKELEGGGDTGFDTRDFLAKVRLNTDVNAPRYQELELKVGVTAHTADETYLGLTESDFRTTSLRRYAASQADLLETDHESLQLRYFLQAGARTDLVVTAYRNEFARNWYKLQSVLGTGLSGLLSDPGAHPEAMAVVRGADSGADALRVRANNRAYLSQGVQGVFGLRLAGASVRHNVEFGLRYHRDDEDRHQWEDGYRMASGRMIRTSEGTPGSQANRLGEATAIALFLQDEIRAGNWAWTPGLRYETIDFQRTDWAGSDPDRNGDGAVRLNSVSVLIPGLGVAYEMSPWTHLFGGAHRGFAPPGPGADEDARAEESLNYELGMRVRRGSIGLNLTGFYSDYENILGRATLATGESGSGELFNGGAVKVWGVEAAVDADLSRHLGSPVRLPVRATYTLSRGSFESSFASGYEPWGTVEAGDHIPYLPEHTHSGSVGAEDAGWAIRLGWNGASAMRTEAGRGPIAEGEGADRFLVFNLTGEISAGGRGTIYGTIQNLTDERYVVTRRPAGARPGLPRTLQIGFRVSH